MYRKLKLWHLETEENYATLKIFSYYGYYIDIDSEFDYLGVLMSPNGKFFKTQKHVADQGRKALFKI